VCIRSGPCCSRCWPPVTWASGCGCSGTPRHHHGRDRPGVPVTNVLLLTCALFLGWLAVQHPAAPAVPPVRPSVPVLI